MAQEQKNNGVQDELALAQMQGSLSLQQGNYEEALTWFMKALEACEASKEDNQGEMARIYSGIAAAYFGDGDYAECIKYASQAIDICEMRLVEEMLQPTTEEHSMSVATDYAYACYLHGIIYLGIEEFDVAISWYEKSLFTYQAIERATGDKLEETESLKTAIEDAKTAKMQMQAASGSTNKATGKKL